MGATLNVEAGDYVSAGKQLITLYDLYDLEVSEIDGVVRVHRTSTEKIVMVQGRTRDDFCEYRFPIFQQLTVETGDSVEAGQYLIKKHDRPWDRFQWQVRPSALVREMRSKLDERHKWVNLSDGGHIENLAGIELLRRRCKFIIIGDGEADPKLAFHGLATLIRYARIDLGIHIDIDPEPIRVDTSQKAVEKGIDNLSREHWAFGTIEYPADKENGTKETGYLLYLKSSYSGDEDEVIKEYRHRNPAFPHESTADQFFDEDQFECYRALGQHIAEKACEELSKVPEYADLSRFENFATAMQDCTKTERPSTKASLAKGRNEKQAK